MVLGGTHGGPADRWGSKELEERRRGDRGDKVAANGRGSTDGLREKIGGGERDIGSEEWWCSAEERWGGGVGLPGRGAAKTKMADLATPVLH